MTRNSQITKPQTYKYSLRMGAFAGTGSVLHWCTDLFYFYLVPPDNAITIESLILHLKVTFDAGVASGDRVITQVGITDTSSTLTTTRKRSIILNKAADGSGNIDLTIDLSTLLDKNNPANTYIIVQAPVNYSTQGIVTLCKADGLYTTDKIQ